MDAYGEHIGRVGTPFVSKELVDFLKEHYNMRDTLSQADVYVDRSESYKLGYLGGINHVIVFLECLQIEQEEKAYDAVKGGE